MIKAIEYVNSKLNDKIRKVNDKVIFEFNHIIIEMMYRIFK
jgi:hypothetical protein